MKKIGYLGPRGTFTEEALIKYASNKSNIQEVEFESIYELLLSVDRGDIHQAVVPIENSLEGAVTTTMDMLAWDVDVKIIEELVIPVRQNLLVNKDSSLIDIDYIVSHQQAIGQCKKFLGNKFPNANIDYSLSTAQAAEEVVKRGRGAAAIGAASLGEIYGLKILFEGIQDEENNMTRFVVVSKEGVSGIGENKISIVFSTENKPGSLYRVLDIFNVWDINLCKIESRPSKKMLGNYIFFVDIEGNDQDIDVQNALMMVKRKTTFYKVLGAYPT